MKKPIRRPARAKRRVIEMGEVEDPLPPPNSMQVDSQRLALYDDAKRKTFDADIAAYCGGINSYKTAFDAVRRFDRIWFAALLAPQDCKMKLAGALRDAVLSRGPDIDVDFLSALASGDATVVDSVILPLKQ